MKTYIKDLKLNEVIERIKEGKVIKDERNNDIIKYCNGMICRCYKDGTYVIGATIPSDPIFPYYFETEEPFEIKEAGLYKTRDGRKVFVSNIIYELTRPVIGVIQGEDGTISWYLTGEYEQAEKSDCDIISKWED